MPMPGARGSEFPRNSEGGWQAPTRWTATRVSRWGTRATATAASLRNPRVSKIPPLVTPIWLARRVLRRAPRHHEAISATASSIDCFGRLFRCGFGGARPGGVDHFRDRELEAYVQCRSRPVVRHEPGRAQTLQVRSET